MYLLLLRNSLSVNNNNKNHNTQKHIIFGDRLRIFLRLTKNQNHITINNDHIAHTQMIHIPDTFLNTSPSFKSLYSVSHSLSLYFDVFLLVHIPRLLTLTHSFNEKPFKRYPHLPSNQCQLFGGIINSLSI